MSTGSCFCGAIQIEFTGEPQGKVLCHCRDCHKISGSVFSTNILVPKDSFKTTKGKPKTIAKKADSGKEITSYFCGDCGTTLYRLGDWNPTGVIIKAGVLDDVDHLTNGKPGVELFAPSRMPWISQVDGSDEKAAMP
ncbi:Mss4-like protein [Elsinoe ampelina]|uniref:Mss4-like protein n=1 Tax=Elsinoe ampelina TaxID=302913 RepID=A0A6A6GEG3_9PEZI|nr:Mss4-like protein [Elsinoe ampelina]